MELAKNFSDETGKEGNPGRFTGHLAQVERPRGCVCVWGVRDFKLQGVVHFTRAARGEVFVLPQVVVLSPYHSPKCTHRCAQTYIHPHRSRICFIHASSLPHPRYESLQTIAATVERVLCFMHTAQHTCLRAEGCVHVCREGAGESSILSHTFKLHP